MHKHGTEENQSSKGGSSRKRNDKLTTGRNLGQRPCRYIKVGYECCPAQCRNVHPVGKDIGRES